MFLFFQHEANEMNRQYKILPTIKDRAGNSISGLTLIECLVAIALMGVTAAIIAPVMIFSVATRVQSQRAEQALQVAQGEVEKIRLMVSRGGDYSSDLSTYPITTASSIVDTSAPTSVADSLDSTTANVAMNINIDDDLESEFAVQVFRSAGVQPPGSTVPIAFEIGVRVYENRAVQNNSGNLTTDAASLSFTSGEGNRSSRPLAVIYTDVFQGDRGDALCEYRKYLDSTASTTGINCI